MKNLTKLYNILNIPFCGNNFHYELIFVNFQALEELGILKKIKRIAGTSVGSMTACMLALGYNSQEIRKVMKKDFSTFFGKDNITHFYV